MVLSMDIFSQTWSNVGSGYPSPVQALLLDSTSNTIRLAGSGFGVYSSNGIVTTNTVATISANIKCFAVYNNELYAGYTGGEGVKKWNGSVWVSLGGGVNTTSTVQGVYSMKVYNNKLYVGGMFTSVSSSSINVKNIAVWDGSTWSPIINSGSGIDISGNVTSMCVYNNKLYVGGLMTYVTNGAGSTSVNNIASYDGIGWSPVGSGLSNPSMSYTTGVLTLAVHNNVLYAGGVFTGIVKSWNGSSWNTLVGGTFTGGINSLCSYDNELYAGGTFTVNSNQHISRWNGSTWSNLGTGVNSTVNTLIARGNELYAGGTFTIAGSTSVNYFAKWNNNLSTGIESSDLSNSVRVYPNPTTDLINIDFNEKFTVKLTDVTGKLLLAGSTSTIDLTQFEAGIYNLTIESNKNSFSKKIIKQ